MKRSHYLVLILFLTIGFSGCLSGGKLTKSKAESTLNQWAKSGSIEVTGIQEILQENAAKADIKFSNFQVKTRGFFGPEQRIYSGPGTAIFTHYNDGRWVLTKVSTSQGLDSVWWDDLNIEAE